jgi:hypothetical protein
MYFAVVLTNLIPILILSFAFIVQFSLPYKRATKVKVLHICILVCFWTFDGIQIMFFEIKIKGKAVPLHTMEALWGEEV